MLKLSISILCGGMAKRFRANKALHKIGERPIIEIIHEQFKRFTSDIFLQGSENELIADVRTYSDVVKGKGPLGGIYSSLVNAKYSKIFITACDLPFIDVHILKELMKHGKYDIVVPQWSNGYYEPLCAVYSKILIPIIKTQLDKNILKIAELFEHANVKAVSIDRLIEEGKIRKDCFKNINFPEDL